MNFHDKLVSRHVVIHYKILVPKKVSLSFYRTLEKWRGKRNGRSFSCSRSNYTKSWEISVTGLSVKLHVKKDSDWTFYQFLLTFSSGKHKKTAKGYQTKLRTCYVMWKYYFFHDFSKFNNCAITLNRAMENIITESSTNTPLWREIDFNTRCKIPLYYCCKGKTRSWKKSNNEKKKQSNYERQDPRSVNSEPEILNLKTYCCLHSVSIKQASDVSHNTEAGNVCVL